MTQHTPGPWEVIKFVDNRHTGSTHHTYKVTPQRGVYGSLFEPDARLIAAAPDLLEALKKLAVEIDAGDVCGESIKAAFAAIAKAEGRT